MVQYTPADTAFLIIVEVIQIFISADGDMDRFRHILKMNCRLIIFLFLKRYVEYRLKIKFVIGYCGSVNSVEEDWLVATVGESTKA